jgi:hypothetical protein
MNIKEVPVTGSYRLKDGTIKHYQTTKKVLVCEKKISHREISILVKGISYEDLCQLKQWLIERQIETPGAIPLKDQVDGD